MKHPVVSHLPNAVTIARMMLAAPIALALYRGGDASLPTGLGQSEKAEPFWTMIALGLIFIAAVSDWLDGYLARALRAQSRVGCLLDPIADKLAFSLPMLALAAVAGMRPDIAVPALIVVTRDTLVTAQRLTRTNSQILTPVPVARLKTAGQAVVLGVAPLAGLGGLTALAGDVSSLWLGGVWAVAALSLWTGCAYVRAVIAGLPNSPARVRSRVDRDQM